MATLAEELPFAAVVDDGKVTMTCSNCFVYRQPVFACKACRTIHYCTKKCQDADWENHKYECAFLRKSGEDKPSALVRILSRVAMRVKRGDIPTSFNGRTYFDMMDHVEEIKAKPNLLMGVQGLYYQVVAFMGEELAPTFEEMLSAYGKYNVNSFGIFDNSPNLMKIGSAYYVGMSAHDHSCRADAFVVTNGPKAILRTMQTKLEYSKNITISYVAVTYPTEKRRDLLKKRHYFHCKCVDCENVERDLVCHSGRSPCCPDGGAAVPLLESNNNGEDGVTRLICTKCKKPVDSSFDQIMAMNQELVPYLHLDRVKEMLDLVNTMADVVQHIHIYDRAAAILSTQNLFLYNLAMFLFNTGAKISRRDVVKRFTLARRDAIQRLFPVGYMSVVYVVNMSIASVVDDITNSTPEEEYEAFRKAWVSLKYGFGVDHPLTKTYEFTTNAKRETYDAYKQTIEKLEMVTVATKKEGEVTKKKLKVD